MAKKVAEDLQARQKNAKSDGSLKSTDFYAEFDSTEFEEILLIKETESSFFKILSELEKQGDWAKIVDNLKLMRKKATNKDIHYLFIENLHKFTQVFVALLKIERSQCLKELLITACFISTKVNVKIELFLERFWPQTAIMLASQPKIIQSSVNHGILICIQHIESSKLAQAIWQNFNHKNQQIRLNCVAAANTVLKYWKPENIETCLDTITALFKKGIVDPSHLIRDESKQCGYLINSKFPKKYYLVHKSLTPRMKKAMDLKVYNISSSAVKPKHSAFKPQNTQSNPNRASFAIPRMSMSSSRLQQNEAEAFNFSNCIAKCNQDIISKNLKRLSNLFRTIAKNFEDLQFSEKIQFIDTILQVNEADLRIDEELKASIIQTVYRNSEFYNLSVERSNSALESLFKSLPTEIKIDLFQEFYDRNQFELAREILKMICMMISNLSYERVKKFLPHLFILIKKLKHDFLHGSRPQTCELLTMARDLILANLKEGFAREQLEAKLINKFKFLDEQNLKRSLLEISNKFDQLETPSKFVPKRERLFSNEEEKENIPIVFAESKSDNVKNFDFFENLDEILEGIAMSDDPPSDLREFIKKSEMLPNDAAAEIFSHLTNIDRVRKEPPLENQINFAQRSTLLFYLLFFSKTFVLSDIESQLKEKLSGLNQCKKWSSNLGFIMCCDLMIFLLSFCVDSDAKIRDNDFQDMLPESALKKSVYEGQVSLGTKYPLFSSNFIPDLLMMTKNESEDFIFVDC